MPADTPIFVHFIEPDATERRVSVWPGQNLMDAALAAGVAGIIGQCGGAINCATCLCDLVPPTTKRGANSAGAPTRPAPSDLPAQDPDELELLSYVEEASKTSRLACQLIATPELDGLVLRVVSPNNCN